jgi:hypothetical protein
MSNTPATKFEAGAKAKISGQAIMAYEKLQYWVQHNLEYGTITRRALTIAKPLIVAGLSVAGVAALGKVIGKIAKKSDEK